MKGSVMKQFVLGVGVGFLGAVLLAASPLQQQKTDPCEGWKIDCLALEAALLMAVDADYDKYQNARDNLGAVMSSMVGGGAYRWETDRLPKSEQMINDKIREGIVRQSVDYAKKMLEERQRSESTALDA